MTVIFACLPTSKKGPNLSFSFFATFVMTMAFMGYHRPLLAVNKYQLSLIDDRVVLLTEFDKLQRSSVGAWRYCQLS